MRVRGGGARSERKQRQSFKLEHHCHAQDFKVHSIILHMYSHLCAKRYMQRC